MAILENGTAVEDADAVALSAGSFLIWLRNQEAALHQTRLKQLDDLDRLVAELTAGGVSVPIRERTRRRREDAPLQIVRKCVEAFDGQEFTLDDLCSKIAEKFPDKPLGRMTVSRRLYDLRRGADPLVYASKREGGARCRYRLRRLSSLLPR